MREPEPADAAAVRQALVRARAAGERLAGRSATSRIDALGRWLDALAEPGGAARRRLVARLVEAKLYSREVATEGLARGLAPFTGDALRRLVARELGDALEPGARRRASGFPVTACLLAGAVPTATLPALLAPLVLGSPVVAKPPVDDPVTAPELARSLAALDPKLGACVEVVHFRGAEEAPLDALLEAECVSASGSDATVAAVAARVAPPRRLVAYGHRFSLALLGPDAWRDGARRAEALRALALDLALWDQQGCLSPRALYIVTGGAPLPESLADDAAEALAAAEARWPSGPLAARHQGAARREREIAELRRAAGEGVALRGDPGGRWAVVVEPDARLRPVPAARFLRIHPVADLPTLAGALAPAAPHLAAMAIAGFDDDRERRPLDALMTRLGVSRICPFGSLQAPPLDWAHDGQPVLLPLARLTDVET